MAPQRHQAEDSKPNASLAGDMMQGVLDPLLMLDDQLQVIRANSSFYEAFDLTREQTDNRSIYDIGSGLWNVPRLHELLEEVREKNKTFKDYELTHNFQTIGRRTMLLNAGKLPSSQGGNELILLAMKDITSRKEAEEALRRSEQKLRMIFENAQDFAIITMDLEGCVTAWNPGAKRLLGYEESEILGQDGRIIFTPEDREQGEADWELGKALREGRAENERWHMRKDGSRFWGSGLVMPLYNDHEVRGLMKIMRDITPQYRLQQERETRARELEQRVAEATAESEERARKLETLNRHLHQAEQRERRRLARLLHDDLQQMLAAISMRLQMVQAQPDAQTGLEEARDLVKQAIEMSRSLSHELSPSILQKHGFIAALQWLSENIHHRHELPVEVKADRKTDELVPTDVGEVLFHMVRELLFNVVKHAQASQAWVTVEPAGEDGLCVAVEDDGVGCDPVMLAGNDTKSGHGLQSIHERLATWQGKLKSEPRPEGGCRVVLEIPALPAN